jgi:double-stranded uracil-DNA glycosylase
MHAISHGFPPVVGRRARVLILGSLPGQASLAARQYYAQPRNAFWKIMGEICGAGPALEYRERLDHLTENAIALWDVLAAGERPGSLDSAIVRRTAVSNDFVSLFRAQPDIRVVCFNGRTAHDLYQRRVLGTLPAEIRLLPQRILPSTSPAHASLSLARKLEAWSVVREYLSGEPGEDTGRPASHS